jgi:glucosylceramidase
MRLPAAARWEVRAQAHAHSAVHVFETTADMSKRLTRVGNVSFTAGARAAGPTIHVNDLVHFQQVIGFGAAMTDSSAWLIHDVLSPQLSAAVMNSLFGSGGIRLNFVRVPMGASDFTANGQPYSYDDLAPGQSDPQLQDFSVAHDDAYIVPTLQQMLQVNPSVEILANPWSPPPWMKANDKFDNIGGLGTLLPWASQTLANYFVKFIQAYASRGIPITAITPQNEPQGDSPFPGMTLTATGEANWVANVLEPALSSARLHPQIYGFDAGEGASVSYPEALLSSPARALLAGIAWHCYGGMNGMSTLQQADPGVVEILSECSPGIIPYPVSEVMIGAMRNWASAVMLWNLALDPVGGPVEQPNYGCMFCTGLVTIGEQKHTYQFRLGYYQVGQMSSFVERGAVRVSTERFVSDYRLAPGKYGVGPGLDNVAFLNPDGGRVLVAYDNSTAPVRFAVEWHNRSFAFKLQPKETVTFTWSSSA